MHIQQKEIGYGNVKQVGLWLKENVRKGDSIYLEPLGYIGYFSEGKMIDYPGLVSPQVVRLLKQNKNLDFYTLVPEIKPDWIILRPREAARMSALEYFQKNYAYIKTFSVLDNLRRYKFYRENEFLCNDAAFTIFKKYK